MTWLFFILLYLSSITIIFVIADFQCNDTTKQCNCTLTTCNKICTDRNPCNDYQFYCDNESNSCSVLCSGINACRHSKFELISTSSMVQCIGTASCSNVLFECGSSNIDKMTINRCELQIDSSLAFIQSHFVCHGDIKDCRFQLIDKYNYNKYGILLCILDINDIIQCAINRENNLISCLENNKCECIGNGTLCSNKYLSYLPDIDYLNSSIVDMDINRINRVNTVNTECIFNIDNDINIWILTATLMIGILISFCFYYFCLNVCGSKQLKYRHKPSVNDDIGDIGALNGINGYRMDNNSIMINGGNDGDISTESTHFESSVWLTMISILFNDDDKTDGIDCGIILIPKKQPIDSILNSIFRGCAQCKVPVTEQFLKHFSKTSQKDASYIIIQGGYIYGHEIYKNQSIYDIANANDYIIIDSQKKETQRHQNSYYRIYVNNFRVKSREQFINVLKSHGIDINLKNDDSTTTWKVRDSLELSSSFFENKAEGMAATNLSNSIYYLQERRAHRTHPEMVGATIVVIPYNKSLTDYKLYLRQYLSVSLEVSDSSLYCIFTHNSILHDGAIFIRGNRIIAVKAFFRITDKYKKKPSIGHGTRHASAQEFSKYAKIHKPITFLLSEEDGLIRSCINGQIKKINNYKNIATLIIQYHYCSKKTTEIPQIPQIPQIQMLQTNSTNSF